MTIRYFCTFGISCSEIWRSHGGTVIPNCRSKSRNARSAEAWMAALSCSTLSSSTLSRDIVSCTSSTSLSDSSSSSGVLDSLLGSGRATVDCVLSSERCRFCSVPVAEGSLGALLRLVGLENTLKYACYNVNLISNSIASNFYRIIVPLPWDLWCVLHSEHEILGLQKSGNDYATLQWMYRCCWRYPCKRSEATT